jgi:hypothetical protein
MGLPLFTDLDLYYDDESQWGDYQYSTLEQIVNNFMYEQEDDSYVSLVDRNRVSMAGKKGVRELYFDVVSETISVEFELNESLIIPLPHDYINYVRMSWVDDNGHLHPFALNRSLNLSQAYLQDSDYNFLYDSNGDILAGNHIQNEPGQDTSIIQEILDIGPLNLAYTKQPFNLDLSKIYKNGSFRIDKTQGVIQFSSLVDGRTIVLDYLTDGLFQRGDDAIKIHKFAEEALYSWIYFSLIKRKRNVPANEKARAEKEWWNYRRIAKRRISPFGYEDVRQVLKGSSKWIKD